MRTFPLGHILSVSGDKLVSPDGIGAVYDLLGYMTGDPPMTHQLPRFARECRPHLHRQMPWLTEIDDSEVNGENWRAWLDDKIERYGAEHEVEPLPTGAHTFALIVDSHTCP